MLTTFILGATYAAAAAIQPGPFQAYLVAQAVTHGWRRTIPAALAPVLSDVPIVTLVLVVLTRMPPRFVHALQVAGGLFVIWLASGAARSARRPVAAPAGGPSAAHRTVFAAVVVNLLNPNPYLAWALVLGPLLLAAWRRSPAHALAFVVAFYVTMVATTAAIVTLVAAARTIGPRLARGLVGVSACALLAFGLYQLWQGVQALLSPV